MNSSLLLFLALQLTATGPLEEAGRNLATGQTTVAVRQLEALAGGDGAVAEDAALALGRHLLGAGRADEARTHLQAVVQRDGLLVDWGRLYLVRALREQGEEDRARKLLEEIELVGRDDPASVELRLERAALRAAAGDHGRAAKDYGAFLEAAKEHPRRREAAAEEARALEGAGLSVEAGGAWWSIWWDDPSSPWAEEAKEKALSLRDASPRWVPPRASPKEVLAHAERLRLAGRATAAVEELSALRVRLEKEGLTDEEKAHHREALYREAEALYTGWRSREAVEAAEKLLRDPGTFRCRALALAARARWIRLSESDRAVETARLIERTCPWSTDEQAEGREEGLWVRAHLHLRKEGLAQAEPLLEEIAAVENRRRDAALWHLGLTRIRLGEREEAAKAFRDLAERTESDGYRRAALYWAARMSAGEAGAGQETSLSRREELLERLLEHWPASYYGHRAAAILGREPRPVTEPEAAVEPLPQELLLQPGALRARRLERAGLADLAGREWLALHRGDSAPPRALVVRAAEAYASTRWAYQGVRLVRRHLGGWEERGQGPRQAFHPRPFWELYRSEAEKRGLDPALPLAISRQESLFDPEIRSWAGAVGLMQLMPATAREEAGKLGLPRPSESDLVDPALNIRLGVFHLAGLLERFGSEAAAVAAYNAGGGRVSGWLQERPLEGEGALEEDLWIDLIPITQTRLYVKGVLEALGEYRRLYPDLGGSGGPPRRSGSR